MKKTKNPNDINVHQRQNQELSKKLYRSTTEQAKRLDDSKSCARNISDLFAPNWQAQRRKFCDYCERLIFSDPVLYGKKGEELLWRKGFYEVVSTAKKLKRKEFTEAEICNIKTHINAGIGFYHHFIARLQFEFHLNLSHVIDFPFPKFQTNQENNQESVEWANSSIHQCLIYLGDLSRYKFEIDPKGENLAFRYYLQAVSFKSDHGMPHNQMGTLAMNRNKYLDAVFHYMRCLACTVSFEGTTNNLRGLFEKNSKILEQPEQKDKVKLFTSQFLSLIDFWYFEKRTNKVYDLCHQTYKNLEECFNQSKTSESCESPIDNQDSKINNDMLFKVVVICLLCISKLQKSNNNQVSTLVAFTLAIYSQLIQNVTNHIQESVWNYPLPEVDIVEQNGVVSDLIKNQKRRNVSLRRRKVVKIESESDDDDDEEQEDKISVASSDDSFASDVLVESSEEEEEHEEKTEVKENENDEDDVIKRIKRMDVNDMLEIISEEGSLQAIKILNDWLMHDTEIIKSCGNNTPSLLRQITNMLNLININVKSTKLSGIKFSVSNVIKNVEKIPLSEDIVLKGVEILSKAHKSLDWNYLHRHGMNAKEENVTRIVKFLEFGKFLTTVEETGITFETNRNIFVCKKEEIEQKNSTNDDNDEDKGQLMKMKHMGQLWLASEVRNLENKVKGKASLSPYLVLDADALIKYTFMVKHFVQSRKFIVLIPSAALDDLKREQSEARDAIRWLESQFHRGNRFFRAQRPQERASIPFIKYPKKKDKEMSMYIQIIECCYFLAQQQKGGASNLITLLIGNQNVLSNGENKDFSYVGLAQSAGITIESITQFYAKWKKNHKTRR